MRKTTAALAGALLPLLLGPAQADAPPGGGYRHYAPRYAPWRGHAGYGHHHRRQRHWRHAARPSYSAAFAPAPVYGPEPPYYPGYGNGSPNTSFGPNLPVALSEYREAYIGRGILYNTPPQPIWPSAYALRVRY